ncbi:YoaK family protein [Chitinimonas koreensis]|uniref:YoaK family protein n=1 Tax=Chitinimonas koreensis TaxID=356302 RepID=UPI0004231589|nr:YoaK family protein [Chitinimonas koreensis]QNM98421.1 DUF1275 domain-containing protein [Chitinimonas koreensis]
MPLGYLRRLTTHQRDFTADRHLGYALAFVAGATNAGGFLAVGQYTSHMTGIASLMADAAALGQLSMAAVALASLVTFVLGAATTALLTNWASRRRLQSKYALSLLLEALLLLLFGVAGSYLATVRDLVAPMTVLLLCFIMGLQNAVITKISGATIRTTHITGIVTDIGIELGKLLYFNRRTGPGLQAVRANRAKLRLHGLLLLNFTAGGVTGAVGFKQFGFIATVPLALGLALLAVMPVLDDLAAIARRRR